MQVQGEVFYRLPAVKQKTGLGGSTIWRLVAQGKFPAPQKISARVSVWRHTDVEAWMSGVWASCTDDKRAAA